MWILQRTYPQHDLLIEAAGARLNVVDLGQRDASAPSNCAGSWREFQPGSDAPAARRHVGPEIPVILIASVRAKKVASTPALRALMIEQALRNSASHGSS